MKQAPNIVQAEFFHVGGDPDMSLSEVMADAMNRAYSGLKDLMTGIDPSEVKPGIKTCVRFYDTSRSLTRFTQKIERAEKKQGDLLKKLQGAKGLRRFWLACLFIRVSKKVAGASKKERQLVVHELEKHVRSKKVVGVETFDHRYRPLRDDERHELLESVRAAKNMWLFLFVYNADLFADNNKGIAYFM